MKKIFILFTILLSATLTNAQIRYLKTVLKGANESTPNSSTANGVAIVKYNATTNYLELWGNYRDLSNTISGSHIHGPAAPGVDAPVLWNLDNIGGTSGGLTGTATLTDAQETELLAGNMYVNVHSTGTYALGEIRGQLTLSTDGQTVFLNGKLQGAQSTPPNASPGTGWVNALIDKSTHTLWLTSFFTNLTANASNAHIHIGAPTVSGGVIVQLGYSRTTTGSLDTSRVITQQIETDILSGNTYVNIHTPGVYAAGEIRAQLLPATQLRYSANTLSGAQEVPPNGSTARGTVIVRYNTETNLLELWGDYQYLTSTISGSHIHGPAAPTATAGVVVNLTNTGGTTGTLTVSQTITEAQEADLLNGLYYVNVHSNPPPLDQGEIRGQLLPLSAGETQFLTAALDADEERAAMPAVTIVSSGVGSSVVVLDKITRNIYLTGSYSNLSSGIINAHIHRHPPGASGPVSVQLQFISGTTAGTLTGSSMNIRASLMDSIINGNSYVNVHTSNYTGGEIRGQVGNLVLPIKLSYFNAYKEQNKVALIWSTPQELSLARYEIEQQNSDTKVWMKKATVSAKGGTSLATYNISDVPMLGRSSYVVYRLKMIDQNGEVSYSPAIKINFNQSRAALMILSNPVKGDVLRFMVTGLPAAEKIEASLVDYSGRIVMRTAASSLMTNELNVEQLPTGVYKLVVRVNGLLLQQNLVR